MGNFVDSSMHEFCQGPIIPRCKEGTYANAVNIPLDHDLPVSLLQPVNAHQRFVGVGASDDCTAIPLEGVATISLKKKRAP
jgi:hypothetical protein